MQNSPDRLHSVIQVGFAGSRHLLDKAAHPKIDEEKFLKEVGAKLASRMDKLRDDLGLGDQHFLCGISQVAIGADTLFAEACIEKKTPLRVFLPQHRDAYLDAAGSAGEDFDDDQRKRAADVLDNDLVIQERLVSDAADRTSRFEDANREIIRVSDVAICLMRAEADGKPGGSHHFLELAPKRNTPVLEIAVKVKNGKPEFEEEWHGDPASVACQLSEALAKAPALQDLFCARQMPDTPPGTVPDADAYFNALKSNASAISRERSRFFRSAVFIIIGTHVFATMLAVAAMKFKSPGLLVPMLLVELLLLASGYFRHQKLHRKEAVQQWALARLVAEVSRSVLAIGKFHVFPRFLFALPFPNFLHPLRRTIAVLHLHRASRCPRVSWESMRAEYMTNRLIRKRGGQLTFYHRSSTRAKKQQNWARRLFRVFSLIAIWAVLTKLSILFFDDPSHHPLIASFAGVLAILAPVFAVAALSLAAAFDLEAREHTFAEMHDFLESQSELLLKATSEREYAELLLETESRLLGETVSWFARRSYTGVS